MRQRWVRRAGCPFLGVLLSPDPMSSPPSYHRLVHVDWSGGGILRILTIMFLILLCLISLLCLYLELRISILHPSNDVYIFQTVARGILNGLIPYQDLLETKPPGIFLLNAMSLFLFEDRTLLSVLNIIFSIVFVMISLITSLYYSRELPFWQSMNVLSGGLLVGMITAIWHATRGGMPDFYATVLCSLYALSLTVPVSWKVRFPLGSICMFGVVFLREPLVPVFLATALLLTPLNWKALIRNVALPGVVGSTIWAAVMWFVGYLGPYIYIYLPTVLIRSDSDPLTRWGSAFVGMVASLWHISPFFVPAIGGMIAFVLLPQTKQNWKQSVGFLLYFIVALFFTMMAVHPLDDSGGYHAFAIPFYSAISILWLRKFRIALIQSQLWGSAISYGITVLLMLTVLTYPLLHYTELAESGRINKDISTQWRIAQQIDAILDDCGQDRYLHLGPIDQFFTGLTRHSPYGPGFFLGENLTRKDIIGRGLVENIYRTNIALVWKTGIVIENGAAPYILDSTTELQRNFQIEPWSCVRHDFTNDLYVLLFRKTPLLRTQ